MYTEIARLFIIYAGILVIALIIKRLAGRLRFGFLGLIFAVQPAAMATYRDMNPWIVLVLVVAGILVLVADIVQRRKSESS